MEGEKEGGRKKRGRKDEATDKGGEEETFPPDKRKHDQVRAAKKWGEKQRRLVNREGGFFGLNPGGGGRGPVGSSHLQREGARRPRMFFHLKREGEGETPLRI